MPIHTSGFLKEPIVLVGQNVRYVNDFALESDASCDGSSPGFDRMSFHVLHVVRWEPPKSDLPEELPLRTIYNNHVRVTKPSRNSTSVFSTTCRSKVDRLITLSTSAVAVCCCKDSLRSSVR